MKSFSTGIAASTTPYPTAGASSGMGDAVANSNGTVASPSLSLTAAVFEGVGTVDGVGWLFGMGAVAGAVVWAL